MRNPNLQMINGSLYEIVRRIPADKIKKTETDSISMDDINLLKQWAGSESMFIYKHEGMHEYLFVNKIDELEIIES